MSACKIFKVVKKVGFFKPEDIIQVSESAKIGFGDYCIFKKGNRVTLKKYKGKDTEYILGKVIKIIRDIPYTPFYSIKN